MNDAACVERIFRDDDTITFAASVATIFYHQANEPPNLTSNTWSSMQKMHEYFLSNAPNGKVGGFGATERIPMVMDFEEELVDLADDVYRQEIMRSIGKSLLIKGTRYYDGTTVFTLPGLPERIKEFLASDAANGISERDRTAFESVLLYPVSEF
ncbi:hypothetical protein [Hwanghaeella sp.]|uniref:hypothetical protein n=1 Tax=Hwanghaeella sp. TaxID=2605943 RepID=UPI003CCC3EDB